MDAEVQPDMGTKRTMSELAYVDGLDSNHTQSDADSSGSGTPTSRGDKVRKRRVLYQRPSPEEDLKVGLQGKLNRQTSASLPVVQPRKGGKRLRLMGPKAASYTPGFTPPPKGDRGKGDSDTDEAVNLSDVTIKGTDLLGSVDLISDSGDDGSFKSLESEGSKLSDVDKVSPLLQSLKIGKDDDYDSDDKDNSAELSLPSVMDGSTDADTAAGGTAAAAAASLTPGDIQRQEEREVMKALARMTLRLKITDTEAEKALVVSEGFISQSIIQNDVDTNQLLSTIEEDKKIIHQSVVSALIDEGVSPTDPTYQSKFNQMMQSKQLEYCVGAEERIIKRLALKSMDTLKRTAQTVGLSSLLSESHIRMRRLVTDMGKKVNAISESHELPTTTESQMDTENEPAPEDVLLIGLAENDYFNPYKVDRFPTGLHYGAEWEDRDKKKRAECVEAFSLYHHVSMQVAHKIGDTDLLEFLTTISPTDPGAEIAAKPPFDLNGKYECFRKEMEGGLLVEMMMAAISDKSNANPEMVMQIVLMDGKIVGYPTGDRLFGTGFTFQSEKEYKTKHWGKNILGEAVTRLVPSMKETVENMRQAVESGKRLPWVTQYAELFQTAEEDFSAWANGAWKGEFGDESMSTVYGRVNEYWNKGQAMWKITKSRAYEKTLKGTAPVKDAYKTRPMTFGEIICNFYEVIQQKSSMGWSEARGSLSSSSSTTSDFAAPPEKKTSGEQQSVQRSNLPPPAPRGTWRGRSAYPIQRGYYQQGYQRGGYGYNRGYMGGGQAYRESRPTFRQPQQVSRAYGDDPIQHQDAGYQNRSGYSQGNEDRKRRSESARRSVPRGRSASSAPRDPGLSRGVADAIAAQKRKEKEEQGGEDLSQVSPSFYSPPPPVLGGAKAQRRILSPTHKGGGSKGDRGGGQKIRSRSVGPSLHPSGTLRGFPPADGRAQYHPTDVLGQPLSTESPKPMDLGVVPDTIKKEELNLDQFVAPPPPEQYTREQMIQRELRRVQQDPKPGHREYIKAMDDMGCHIRDDRSCAMHSELTMELRDKAALRSRKYLWSPWKVGREQTIWKWESYGAYATEVEAMNSRNLKQIGYPRTPLTSAEKCAWLSGEWYKERGMCVMPVDDFGFEHLSEQWLSFTAEGQRSHSAVDLPRDVKVLILGDSNVELLGTAMVSASMVITRSYPYLPDIWGYRHLGWFGHGKRWHQILGAGTEMIDRTEDVIVLRGQLDGADVLLSPLQQRSGLIDELADGLVSVAMDVVQCAHKETMVILVLPAPVTIDGSNDTYIRDQLAALESLYHQVKQRLGRELNSAGRDTETSVILASPGPYFSNDLLRRGKDQFEKCDMADYVRGVHLTYRGQALLGYKLQCLVYRAMIEKRLRQRGYTPVDRQGRVGYSITIN